MAIIVSDTSLSTRCFVRSLVVVKVAVFLEVVVVIVAIFREVVDVKVAVLEV